MVKQPLILAGMLLVGSLQATSLSPSESLDSLHHQSGYSPTLSPQQPDSDTDSPKTTRSNSLTLAAEGSVTLHPSMVYFANDTTEIMGGRTSPFYPGRKLICPGIKRFDDLPESEKRFLRAHLSCLLDEELMVPVSIDAAVHGCNIGEDLCHLPLKCLPIDQAKNAPDGRSQHLELFLEDYQTRDEKGMKLANLKVCLELRKFVIQAMENGKEVRDRLPFVEMLANMRDYYQQRKKIEEEENAVRMQHDTCLYKAAQTRLFGSNE